MVDRSTFPYEENVDQVMEIVKIAHAVGVSVEAELGHVGFGHEYEKTRDSGLTNPNQAIQICSGNRFRLFGSGSGDISWHL
jgi:fructose-bisphosphate aldolase, class II